MNMRVRTPTFEVSKSLATLLEELDEECQNIVRLLVQLKIPNLTLDQASDLLAELGAAVVHLHEHTRGLPDLIDDELERLPE